MSAQLFRALLSVALLPLLGSSAMALESAPVLSLDVANQWSSLAKRKRKRKV